MWAVLIDGDTGSAFDLRRLDESAGGVMVAPLPGDVPLPERVEVVLIAGVVPIVRSILP